MLELIVFLCGAVVMILEMVGSRILAPYLGTSIVVWTSLIGIILGCLSLGYWWGGKLADERPSYRILSFIVLLSAFFIAVIAFSKSFVLGFLQARTSSLHMASAVGTFLLFAPPSILLGTVSPYAVRLKINDLQDSGKTVGTLYAISTMGSIFGTFLAGFFLIGFFGSTNILLVLSVILVVASLLASLQDRLVKVAAMGIFLALLLAANGYDSYLAGREFYDIDTHYSRILVYNAMDQASGRNMRVMVTSPRGRQSAMYLDDPIELAGSYTKFYKMALHFKPDAKSMLMLGGGGYSFPKYAMKNYPQVRMDVVEIDPRVTELARRFFAYEDDPRLAAIHEDARTFLNKMESKKYDIILCDTFNSHYSIPFHLSTIEAVKRLHEGLVDDGAVLANILCSIEGDTGRFLRAEYATFKAVFPQVYLFPVVAPNDGKRWQNVMLVALKSNAKPEFTSTDADMNGLLSHLWQQSVPDDLPPLTDEYAPVDRYITVLR
jgi:spermidine synthase